MKNIKILVPTDFSDLSLKAFEAASMMVNLVGGSVTPFHAYIPISEMDSFYYTGVGISGHVDYEQVESTIKDRLDEVAGNHMDKKYLKPGLVGIGNPAHAITEAADDYDLIILTTHGRSGFSRFLLGSVSEKVIRMCHTPVMIIEKESKLTPIKKILVTTDFSDNSMAAFNYANDISSLSGASVDLLHVIISDEYDTEAGIESDIHIKEARLNEFINDYFKSSENRVKPKIIRTDSSVHEAVFSLNKEEKYNLIIMATIGRTGLEYLMMGSTASHIVRHIESAVLSINPRQKGA